MKSPRLLKNSVIASAQALITGCSLFILYYYLVRKLGVELLGVWAVILAATSVTKISEFGLSGSVVKFVANYIAKKEEETAAHVVEVVVLIVGALMGGILLLSYGLLVRALVYFLPVEVHAVAREVLPYALLSFWLGVLSGVIQSGLDGCQRIDLRGIMVIAGQIVYLGGVFLLVPGYGLRGLALAQVGQSVFLLALGLLMLRRLLPISILPVRWDVALFKEMFSYGVSFQLISILIILSDPVTKFLLSKFGDLTTVSYFEMANRMVLQIRSLLISANQSLVPYLAHMEMTAPSRIRQTYLASYNLFFYLSLPTFSGIIAASPFISYIWLGRLDETFIAVSSLLAFGWMINTFSGTAYFANMASGRLRWNLLSHLLTGAMNLALGWGMGMAWGSEGVIAGYFVSIAAGSLILIVLYHGESAIKLRETFPAGLSLLAVACLAGVVVAYCAWAYGENVIDPLLISLAGLLSYMSLVVPCAWRRLHGLVRVQGF